MKKPVGLRLIFCLSLFLASMGCAARKNVPDLAMTEGAETFMAKASRFAANAQYDGANFFLGKAANSYISEKRWERAAQCLVHMGSNWQKIGDLEQAKTAFSRALQITMAHNEGANLEFAKAMLQLAFKLLVKKEYVAALELMNRGLAMQQKIYGADHPELGKIYNSLALLYLHMGDRQKANEFSNKSLSAKMRGFLNTDSSFLKNYSFLDGVNISERSFQDMSGMLDKSLDVYLESLGDDHPLVASIYEKLGMVCALQGTYEQGLDYFRKALRIWQDTVSDEGARVAVLFEEIGICLRLQGELPDARRYLQQALDIAVSCRQPGIMASIYYQIGKVCFLQNQYSEALQQFQLSLASLAPGLNPSAPDFVLGMETVTEKQNLMEILAAQAEAFEARAGLRSFEKTDLRAAFHAIQGAIQLIDRLRADCKSENYRLLFGEKSQRILDLAVRIALKLHATTGANAYRESAFVFSEKSKAALLSENMLESAAKQFAGIPLEKLTKEKELKNELAQYETILEKQFPAPDSLASTNSIDMRSRYFARLAEYQELIASFENEYPRYFELKYGNRDVSLASLQQSLPGRTALIEYFLCSTQITIFFLSHDRFEVVSQALEPRFAQTIANYSLAIKKIDEKTFLQLSPNLYRILIAPIETWLQDKENLLIIPDGVLAYLPFETLIRDVGQGADFSQLDFLIRRFTVSYHFSGHLWQKRLSEDASTRPMNWAGFAPVFSGNDLGGFRLRPSLWQTGDPTREDVTRTVTVDELELPELPGTENELRSIIGLFASQKNKALGFFHSQATETLFKSTAMKEFSMIHLATHSLTNESNPKLSGFLFYPPQELDGDDGILYAGETYNLHLDCDLLVLSSCESGSGRLVEGEGMLALTRGLFYSGARNIIFTLWKVEDRTAGELMVQLYQGIMQGESFAPALKKAKLSFISDPYTAFPKYWAGFIYLGN